MNSPTLIEADIVGVQLSDNELLFAELGVLSGQLAEFLRERFADDLSPVMHAVGFLEAQRVQWQHPQHTTPAGSCRERCLRADNPLGELVRALDLSDLEIRLLLVAGLSEQHEGYADIFRLLHPVNEPRATVGLVAQLLCPADADRLFLREVLGAGKLVSTGAVNVVGDGPLFVRNLMVSSTVWTLLLGGQDSLVSAAARVGNPVLAGLSAWFESSACAVALKAVRDRCACTIWIVAEDSEIAFQRALALVHHAKATALPICLPVSANREVRQSLWLQTCLLPQVPVIQLDGGETTESAVSRWPELMEVLTPLIICSDNNHTVEIPGRTNLTINLDSLAGVGCRDMWSELTPELSPHAVTLASRFPVEPYQADRIVQDVRGQQLAEPMTLETVVQGFRNRTASRCSNLMEYIRPVAQWSQLVLPAPQLEQMQDAVQRFHLQETVLDQWKFLSDRRGATGVKLLFCGPPGTGKTLSAEVMANALGVDLMVVDLSKIVSKWIGETEKNLAQVFTEAEQIKAVLFFDEADALFGKRTEVSDAHDRYANLETAYLLTRLERFSGLTILATNFRRNIDAAFVRRLDFIVELREPAAEERELLWRCHLPDSAPVSEDVDLGEIARLFPIVGGQIRNAALSAAYFAAHEKTRISSRHLIKGVRREYEKAGKAFRELAVNE